MVKGNQSENSLEGEFVRAVRITECCVVTTDETDSDLQVRVIATRYENPAALIPAVITGISLYTIPSFATVTYTFEVSVANKQNKQSSYKIEDSWALVQWLPMMFARPFAAPSDADESVIRNMYKHLLHKLHEDGFI